MTLLVFEALTWLFYTDTLDGVNTVKEELRLWTVVGVGDGYVHDQLPSIPRRTISLVVQGRVDAILAQAGLLAWTIMDASVTNPGPYESLSYSRKEFPLPCDLFWELSSIQPEAIDHIILNTQLSPSVLQPEVPILQLTEVSKSESVLTEESVASAHTSSRRQSSALITFLCKPLESLLGDLCGDDDGPDDVESEPAITAVNTSVMFETPVCLSPVARTSSPAPNLPPLLHVDMLSRTSGRFTRTKGYAINNTSSLEPLKAPAASKKEGFVITFPTRSSSPTAQTGVL
ncbi:hypothetical protein JB92DRAFT_3149264 [Gautieria morchelliformis]|nr:hypothetical protein JB92DRAFT_3149264 [Gautieria morchelliformis]